MFINLFHCFSVILGVLFLNCGVSTAHHYIALSRQQNKNEEES